MPNLDFYATDQDWPAVLETVFDLGLFRVFEADSELDCELREFHTAAEVSDDRHGGYLALHVAGAGPDPIMKRIEFLPDVHPAATPSATHRFTCEGWGLVWLHHGAAGTQELRRSYTNHNTEKRAKRWAVTVPRLGDPAEWDWPAVTSASGKLNRAIRRLAVSKIGPHPVLPHAAQFIADAGLRHVYGDGIHATLPAGLR